MTTAPAEMLGIADRVGSLEVGKDGDVALFDGDPFEYTSHVVGTIIDGRRCELGSSLTSASEGVAPDGADGLPQSQIVFAHAALAGRGRAQRWHEKVCCP